MVEQSLPDAIGALIESMDYRGRAAPSALRESYRAKNAGLQGPLFHGGVHSVEGFPTQMLFARDFNLSGMTAMF